MALHVTKSTSDPAAAPTTVGQHWINTSTSKHWLAKGTSSASDWVLFAPTAVSGGSLGTILGQYKISTTVGPTPASGTIRYDNATQTSAANLYVSETTNPGVDISIFLNLISVGSAIIIQDLNNSANYQIWTISSITDSGTYRSIGVTLSSSGGTGTTGFANNHEVFLAAVPVGGTSEFADNVFFIKGSADATKKVRHEVDGLTTATTRVVTYPDSDFTFVGTTLTQTLQNKTLDNTNTITSKVTLMTFQDPTDTTKTFNFVASAISTGTNRQYTLPNGSGTLCVISLAQTLTNKTIDSANNTITLAASTITSGTIADARLPNPATSAISASDIDWSTLKISSGLYTKTLSANTTFTFSNRTAGQTIMVRLTNTASNYTVTWPTVKWTGGVAPTMTTGAKSDIYTFVYDGTDVFGSVVQNL